MEEHHREVILALKPDARDKVIVLNISDEYPRDHPELIETLKAKLTEQLEIEW